MAIHSQYLFAFFKTNDHISITPGHDSPEREAMISPDYFLLFAPARVAM
jgi:hypothetical protein